MEFVRYGAYSREHKPPRCVNLETKEILTSAICFGERTDELPVLAVETGDGYKIVCTDDTQIFTADGWMPVSHIHIGDVIWVNGDPPDPRFKDKDWLERMYIQEKRSQKEIAKMCGTSVSNVHRYLYLLGIKRYERPDQVGDLNCNHKEELSRKGGYERSYAEYERLGIIKHKCSLCDKEGNTQMHHIDHDPTNTSPDNFIELCSTCHKAMHVGYTIRHVRRAKVTAVYSAGYAKCCEIDTNAHNVIIEGFVVRGTRHGSYSKT